MYELRRTAGGASPVRAASRVVRIGGARVARPRGASGNAGAKRAPVGTSETCDRTGIAGRYRAEILRRGFSVDHAEPRRRGDRRDASKAFTHRRSRETARIEHGQSARVQLNIGVVPDVDPLKKSFVLALGTSDERATVSGAKTGSAMRAGDRFQGPRAHGPNGIVHESESSCVTSSQARYKAG